MIDPSDRVATLLAELADIESVLASVNGLDANGSGAKLAILIERVHSSVVCPEMVPLGALETDVHMAIETDSILQAARYVAHYTESVGICDDQIIEFSAEDNLAGMASAEKAKRHFALSLSESLLRLKECLLTHSTAGLADEKLTD